MLKRRIVSDFMIWKGLKKKKVLVVQGARQVGKTCAVRIFAEKCYDELLEINFKETPSAKDIFIGDLDVEKMITALRFRYPEKKIRQESTLIIPASNGCSVRMPSDCAGL